MQQRLHLTEFGQWRVAVQLLLVAAVGGSCRSGSTGVSGGSSSGVWRQMEVFPRVARHVHGSTIVELPNGGLLAAWFEGSGERWADDVKIMGARLAAGSERWGEPFLLADMPGFPDINPVLFLDPQKRLWLMWYTVIANQWETSLIKYRISTEYQGDGPPKWAWQEVLHVKPGDNAERGITPQDRFVASVERQVKDYGRYLSGGNQAAEAVIAPLWRQWSEGLLAKARGEDMMRSGWFVDEAGTRIAGQMGYPYFRRMGWQTRNKAVVANGRIIVPLYSDGFSFSLMAISDDCGETWRFSEPLVAPGSIQPAIAMKADGTLAAYMRDNGPPPKRLHVSTSADGGLTWSSVRDCELPNPGSAADIATLQNGHWALVYNDTTEGRHSLAVSVSKDEGRTWGVKRHLEMDGRAREVATSNSYPAIIQGRDGRLHVVYSHHRQDAGDSPGKTIKYACFDEGWIGGR